ncbi:MAG: YHS domain-containing protein [Thermoguttaceae bacterium]|nr:YHS domain-containing protein [Thermoguttaceae bacterium]
MALDGYCAVSLAEKERWVKGNPRFGVIHEGRTYLFAGPDEARRFYEEPERFAPAMSGNDVVLLADRGQTVPGRREHGAWYGGRVYLFASEDSYAKFAQDPKRYVAPTGQPAASTARRSDASVGSNDQGIVPPNVGTPASRSAAPWETGPETSAPGSSTPYQGGSQPSARHSAPSWRS